jgi:hypothetical protein
LCQMWQVNNETDVWWILSRCCLFEGWWMESKVPGNLFTHQIIIICQWLRLAHSDLPNSVSSTSCLRTETDPSSKTLFSLEYWIGRKSENLVSAANYNVWKYPSAISWESYFISYWYYKMYIFVFWCLV